MEYVSTRALTSFDNKLLKILARLDGIQVIVGLNEGNPFFFPWLSLQYFIYFLFKVRVALCKNSMKLVFKNHSICWTNESQNTSCRYALIQSHEGVKLEKNRMNNSSCGLSFLAPPWQVNELNGIPCRAVRA